MAARMGLPTGNLSRLLASTSIRLQGGEFQRPWKRGSMIAKWPLEVEIAMGAEIGTRADFRF